jgi:alpha-glucosidase (family GH31 glycosyl hydrolase)
MSYPEDRNIIDAVKDTLSGAAEAVTSSITGAKDLILGKADEAKMEIETSTTTTVETNAQGQKLEQVWAKSDQQVDVLESEACKLKCEGMKQLEQSEGAYKRAETAQEIAKRASEFANQKTEEALRQELQAKEKLVQAGNRLMEAGAQLQAEAGRVGAEREATVNVHMEGGIRQKTEVDVAPVQEAQLRVQQEKQQMECRMVNTQEQMTYEEKHRAQFGSAQPPAPIA